MCVCVSVCELCVRARARVCVCACVFVLAYESLLFYHTTFFSANSLNIFSCRENDVYLKPEGGGGGGGGGVDSSA